jgi:hypothetical protein
MLRWPRSDSAPWSSTPIWPRDSTGCLAIRTSSTRRSVLRRQLPGSGWRRGGRGSLRGLCTSLVLWNTDTGVVLFGAWALLLVYQSVAARDLFAAARHFTASVFSLAVTLGLFVALAIQRTGKVPDFGLALAYQRVFYLSGYCMLPMPLWHPWILVALVYATGLLVAMAALAARAATPRTSLYFHLSVTGVGLFAYYQGRSHDTVFQFATFPALLLTTLFLDDMVRRTREVRGGLTLRAGVALLLAVLAIESASLAVNTPAALRFSAARLSPVFAGASTRLTRNVQFVKKFAGPGNPMLFLTLDSGILSLAANAPSPVPVPGTVELVLRKDFETLEGYLATSSPTVIFDQSWYGPTVLLVNALLRSYRVLEVSPDGDLVVLSR